MNALEAAVRDGSLTAFRELLAQLAHPFWDRHFSLQGKRLSRPTALLGSSRIGDLVANLYFPGAAMDHAASLDEIFDQRVEQAGAPVRATARVLGVEREPGILYNMGLQQGLLQLAEDLTERPPEQLVAAFFQR